MRVRITKTWGYGDKSKIMQDHERVCGHLIGELIKKEKDGCYRVVDREMEVGCWAKEYVVISP